MRAARLGSTGIETSVLGFGCADLLSQASRGGRQRLLETAYEAGIRHFDTAPMYGLGLAERELGRFANGRRDRIVVATKFGIFPTTAARVFTRVARPLQGPLAAARRRTRPAGADPRGGAAGSLLYRTPAYDGAAARESLERSLRELGTDFVDILFLHDPTPGDVRSDDVRAYLEAARAEGKIRTWGVAGEPSATLEVADRLDSPVVQIRADIFSRSPAAGRPTILFGFLKRALPRIIAHAAADEDVRRRWSDAVGVDCGDPSEVAALLLQDALQANGGGPVLFSTSRPERIDAAAAAAEAEPALDPFRALVRQELGATGAGP